MKALDCDDWLDAEQIRDRVYSEEEIVINPDDVAIIDTVVVGSEDGDE